MNAIRRPRRAGFTLIELLVVVAIIGLLIGILIPALNAARTRAKETQSRSVLASIETGIETFRADPSFGGSYPPSRPDGDDLTVANPYRNSHGVSGNNFEIAGAGLLVWALAGADYLGTPGFRTFDSDSDNWSEDTHDGDDGAYELTDDGEPVNARAELFINIDNTPLSRSINGGFEIENERAYAGSEPRKFPMFLDGFGYPVLYYRADPAGRRLVDEGVFGVDPEYRGVYHWDDNAILVGFNLVTSSPDQMLRLNPADMHHFLWNAPQPTMAGSGRDTAQELLQEDQYKGTFARYIVDPDVRARLTAQKNDSYLLITPGADGIYGTPDDITNFDHNGVRPRDVVVDY